MYSSVSSPLPLAKSLFFPMILKPQMASVFLPLTIVIAASSARYGFFRPGEFDRPRRSQSGLLLQLGELLSLVLGVIVPNTSR